MKKVLDLQLYGALSCINGKAEMNGSAIGEIMAALLGTMYADKARVTVSIAKEDNDDETV